MPRAIRRGLLALTCATIALVPALAQQSPESILPPGFGSPPPSEDNTTTPAPADSPPPVDAGTMPGDPSDPFGNLAQADNAFALDNASIAATEPLDLPPEARRSTEEVGSLPVEDGGFAADAFGDFDGPFLATLMQRLDAPIASRWASILLRRALLSRTTTPAGIAPADWIAERAILLARMGEADNARALVNAVDAANYTPRLYDAAMQAALASADPAMLCGVADAATGASSVAGWSAARAICAGLSGESGTASALIDEVRDARRAGGIDLRLAQKVAAAGGNARRAITVEWDPVERLTAWRFGLAAATAVAIPSRLFLSAGPQVQAWFARAPLFGAGARAAAADRAATLGVFSSAALVELHAALFDEADPSERDGTTANALRLAFAAENEGARLAALRGLWSEGKDAPLRRYARYILTARAAARLTPNAATEADDIDNAVAAMLSAGLDRQASAFASVARRQSLARALLAVGAPAPVVSADLDAIEAFGGLADRVRGQFLFAGLAGLDRLSQDAIDDGSARLGVDLKQGNSWTNALDRAVAQRAPATVALIAAVGLQTNAWSHVPPGQLYRIVAALRSAGLEAEARMIAAEALTRS